MAIRIVDTEPVNKIQEPVNKKPDRPKRGRPKVHLDRAAYRREWMRRRRLVASPTVEAH